MRFSQKIVAASSLLLLITVVLLSMQQLSTVKKEVEDLVDTSLTEMVKGVKTLSYLKWRVKKSLAMSTHRSIGTRPAEQNAC